LIIATGVIAMIIDSDKGFTTDADVQLLQTNKVDTIGRYYCSDIHSYKLISRGEAQKISKANIRLFVVFEDGPVDLTKGDENAQKALDCANNIKQPDHTAIYFALEGPADGFDVNRLPEIRNYFTAIRNKIAGKFEIGIYSNGVPCRAMLQEGYCKYTWLAAASYAHKGTKEFFASGLWTLAQVAPTDMTDHWNNRKIDINVSNTAVNKDFGSFLVPVGP
jgi:Domain of unknown function (DUF1906)